MLSDERPGTNPAGDGRAARLQVQTTAHQRFEGVLVSVSSENDAALGMVNLVDETDPKRIDPKEVKDKLIFKTDKIVTMTVRNVDLDYAAKCELCRCLR